MTRMNDKNLISKIAILYYLEDLTQVAIAKKFNISRVTVSKYLDKAVKEKIVKIEISSENADLYLLEREMEKKFNLIDCKIFPDYDNEDIYALELGKSLDSFLKKHLKNNSIIGIGWGTTLKKAVDSIENRKKNSNIKIIPMIGSLGQTHSDLHTNYISKILAEKLGGQSYLIHAPAVFDNPKTKEVYEKETFQKEILKLWEKIDIAILTMAELQPNISLFKYSNLDKNLISYLKELEVIGDVNMVFINNEGKVINSKFDNRILRTPVDNLKKINIRVGLAYGDKKTNIIKAALKGNLINALITNEKNARRFLENG